MADERSPQPSLPDTDFEFVARVVGYLESRLSLDELARFQTELAADSLKQKAFVRLCLTRAALIEEMRRRQGSLPAAATDAIEEDLNETHLLPAMRRQDQTTMSEDKAESPPMVAKPIQGRPKRSRRWWRGWAAAIAVPLLLAIMAWRAMHAQPKATIVLAVDAVWSDQSHSFNPGNQLPSGPVVLKSGLAQIDVEGTTLVLQGPAQFEVLSDKALFLRAGKLVARVPHSGVGFRVQTPLATIVDLGTEFGVEVRPDKETHVEVLEGQVTAQAVGAPMNTPPTTIVAHKAALISPASPVVQSVEATPLTFVRPSELASHDEAATADGYKRWHAFSDSLRQDPSLVAYYTFDRSTQDARSLLNLAGVPGSASQFDGRLGGTDAGIEHAPIWATGRWPGKGALEFNAWTKTRVVLPPIPAFIGATTSTIALWVKPNDAEHSGHLINEVTIQHDLGLQHDRLDLVWIGSNSPQFPQQLVYFDRGGGPVLFPGILPRQSGWTLLVVTVDAAGQANVYLNGEFIVAKAVPSRTLPAHAMWLGETTTADESSHEARNETFGGLMDELALFNRALTHDEIQRMYEAGRPD